ncbi:hypothetical protein SY27_11420 [Flavobacterium sp. 316]|uniref:DUF2007 domain-containing protein n=1 Tax=Flavobacterium sediminilitoris TaxID=2024526 RepID=A0ABY4HPW8_9FLAO|nr:MULTISPECIES: hypothetical protein [Flavobacterium]KIX20518.1 hypothetical protein SY27_11420 [Flavobacterium sp. 316]UOX34918.1 DUF2007 domain-containing protein [Flavobacterium sediminilitoris]
MKNYITVAIFNFQHETYIVKNLLEQEDIQHFFENETLVSIDPFASIAYGGIKLKVHPNDIKRTKEILDSLKNDNHLKIV